MKLQLKTHPFCCSILNGFLQDTLKKPKKLNKVTSIKTNSVNWKMFLPTPNEQRTASGAPGKKYSQQKVDYVMDITLDDKNQKIYGEEIYYLSQ